MIDNAFSRLLHNILNNANLELLEREMEIAAFDLKTNVNHLSLPNKVSFEIYLMPVYSRNTLRIHYLFLDPILCFKSGLILFHF